MAGKRSLELQYLLREADGTLSQITDASVLANLFAKDGDISDYSSTTDSLEALSDAIGNLSTCDPFLASVGGALDATAATGAVSDAKTAMGYLKQLITRIEEIVIDVTGINGSSIPAMVGTDSAALASVLGALNDVAATGAVSDAKTQVAYLKQAITRLEEIVIDVTGINGSSIPAMVGTDSAFLAAVGGALATAAHTGAVDDATTVMGYIKQMATNSEMIRELGTLETQIFPSMTNLTCTLTAHANANEYSAYTEIEDSAATTLSSIFAATDGHITGMITEAASEDDTAYIVELSYGVAHTIVSMWRLVSGTSKVSSTGQSAARGVHIPAGETIYARVMCETASSKTLTVHFRHFLHS